jgi:tight adherence protein C
VTGAGIAPALASAGVGCLFASLASRRRPVLARVAVVGHPPSPSPVERVGSTIVARRLVGTSALGDAIEAARWPASVETVAGWAVVLAVVSAGLCVGIGGVVVVLAPVLAAVTLRSPAFFVARVSRRRLRAIDRDVPLLLDVLSLASYAGLPPPAALRRAVDVMDGPLAAELSMALEDVDLGSRWRDRLERLSRDLDVADLDRAVSVLIRSESIGSATAEPIAILADDIRASRRAIASERARKAPVQMLFPLVFLVLPAFLLLTVVPVLVATLGSIR